MPQCEMNALLATSHYLPEIARQLAIANKLKALELRKGIVGDSEELRKIASEIDN